jgi:phosphate transport system substrate-binding protein
MAFSTRCGPMTLTLAPATPADLVGAGSSFVAPIMKKWVEAYKETSGVALSYGSVGSSAGIKQIKEGAVDFGASGSRPSRWWKNGLAKRWPMVRPPWVEVSPDRHRSAAV